MVRHRRRQASMGGDSTLYSGVFASSPSFVPWMRRACPWRYRSVPHPELKAHPHPRNGFTDESESQVIARKLNGSAIEAFWSGTSFLLASTVFQPSFASFSHIFGRRPMVLLALTFFTAGTIIAALARDFTVLLVGRSVQGVGGGGIIALTYVIVTDLVTLRERGKWFGLISMMWAIGSVSGYVKPKAAVLLLLTFILQGQ